MAPQISNQAVIKKFWRDRANQKSNRWTTSDLMQFELNLLRSINRMPQSILDLGAGNGELSRMFASGRANLTAVDFERQFERSFLGANETFVHSSVTEFRTEGTWDIVLLMGVATYLTTDEASALYRKIPQMIANGGAAIIKHQVSLRGEKSFSGFSEELGAEYWARYPSLIEEHQLLREFFGVVEKISYPREFKRWPDTEHVAFICKTP